MAGKKLDYRGYRPGDRVKIYADATATNTWGGSLHGFLHQCAGKIVTLATANEYGTTSADGEEYPKSPYIGPQDIECYANGETPVSREARLYRPGNRVRLREDATLCDPPRGRLLSHKHPSRGKTVVLAKLDHIDTLIAVDPTDGCRYYVHPEDVIDAVGTTDINGALVPGLPPNKEAKTKKKKRRKKKIKPSGSTLSLKW